MHLHYFMMRHLGDWLRPRIEGAVLMECFSQNKDELVLGFGTPAGDQWLRVSCNPGLPFICPSGDYKKAKRNTASLFPEINGMKVREISVPDWERALVLHFENDLRLTLKMHGMQSNIILADHSSVLSLFRDKLKNDQDYNPQPGIFLNNWMDFLQKNPGIEIKEALSKISPALDKYFATAIIKLTENGIPLAEALSQILTGCSKPEFVLCKEKGKLKFFLKSISPETGLVFKDIGEGLQSWMRIHFLSERYTREYLLLKNSLEESEKKTNTKLNSTTRNLEHIRTERNPEELGDLIMAQLHLIKMGDKEVELEDYYNKQSIKLKLKPELNGQQNASEYYQKSKKRKQKEKFLAGEFSRLELQQTHANQARAEFDKLPVPEKLGLVAEEYYAALKQMEIYQTNFAKLADTEAESKGKKEHPFIEFTHLGFKIFIGRNSKSNDELTFRFSRREDLWLHVRDQAGSHVVVRQRPGIGFPEPVIEFAASLAAKFSKRKGEAWVSVMFTPRKFVRKPKGAAAGEVLVEREETIMVAPAE